MSRRSALPALLVLGVLAAVGASLFLGSADLSPVAVLDALTGRGDEASRAIVLGLRLPRALLGLLVGGALALSGATLQALLGNPLADPFLLGVSGGAACGTLTAGLLGLSDLPGASFGSVMAMPLAGLLGALVAVLLVGLGASVDGHLDRGRLLLCGVVVNALASAVILFLLSVGDPSRSRGFVFWMLGSLSGASLPAAASLGVYALAGLLVLLPLSRELDALLLGEETASTLGVPVERVKRVAYVAASLVSAAAVAHAGIIGFVGLLVPHAVRRLVRGHRTLLWASFLGGGLLLLVADLVARRLFAPAEVSVGAVTALIGAPAFLLLLRSRP